MNDVQAIVDVTIAYAWAIDSKDWRALDEVFTPDATAEMPQPLSGRDHIVSRIARTLEPLLVSQHIVSNHQVEVNGNTATCRCYLQAQHVRKIDGKRQNFVVGGSYADNLVRTSDGWRIVHRRLLVTWTEGNPDVVEVPR